MCIYKHSVRVFGLIVLFVCVLAQDDNISENPVLLSSVNELLTEAQYRFDRFEFQSKMGKWYRNEDYAEYGEKNNKDIENLVNETTSNLFEAFGNYYTDSKNRIEKATSLREEIIAHEFQLIKKLINDEEVARKFREENFKTSQTLKHDLEELSQGAILMVESISDLDSLIKSIQDDISRQENTADSLKHHLQIWSDHSYESTEELEEAGKKLTQIESDYNQLDHPDFEQELMKPLLLEQKNLKREQEEFRQISEDIKNEIYGITEKFSGVNARLEGVLDLFVRTSQAIRENAQMDEKIQHEISDLTKEIQLNSAQEASGKPVAYPKLEEEIAKLRRDIETAKLGRSGGYSSTELSKIVQEVEELRQRCVTEEEARKLLEIPEDTKCSATLQPSPGEAATINVAILSSGKCKTD